MFVIQFSNPRWDREDIDPLIIQVLRLQGRYQAEILLGNQEKYLFSQSEWLFVE
jgi:hypothetical protein